jgi:hypothetical protein
MFALSDVERRLPIQSLSAWAEAHTSMAQAWQLSGAKPNARVLLRLVSDAIRQVRVSPGQSLDVVWEQAMIDLTDGNAVPDTRPGAEGHVGIRHLEKGTPGERKIARFRLAEAARAEVLPPEMVSECAADVESTGLDPSSPS